MWDKIVSVWSQMISVRSLTILLFLLPMVLFTGVIILATLWKDYAQKISKEEDEDDSRFKTRR